MTFELFDKILHQLMKWNDFCEKVSDATNDAICLPELCPLDDDIVKLLEIIMEDKENDWIGYFCWELNFGRRYKPGMITDGDKDIPLATTRDLYNLLLENMKEGKV